MVKMGSRACTPQMGWERCLLNVVWLKDRSSPIGEGRGEGEVKRPETRGWKKAGVLVWPGRPAAGFESPAYEAYFVAKAVRKPEKVEQRGLGSSAARRQAEHWRWQRRNSLPDGVGENWLLSQLTSRVLGNLSRPRRRAGARGRGMHVSRCPPGVAAAPGKRAGPGLRCQEPRLDRQTPGLGPTRATPLLSCPTATHRVHGLRKLGGDPSPHLVSPALTTAVSASLVAKGT